MRTRLPAGPAGSNDLLNNGVTAVRAVPGGGTVVAGAQFDSGAEEAGMDGVSMLEQESDTSDPLTDDELAALALAADPDVEVADDAISVWELIGPSQRRISARRPLLPEWWTCQRLWRAPDRSDDVGTAPLPC